MPFLRVNGVRLSYRRSGRGEPVLLITGSGAAGHQWDMYQTPALHEAGYATVTFDSRGVPPSDAPAGEYTMADMVADVRGLIEALDLAPCRIVGTSLGALIAQRLAIGAPRLVRSAVLMATRARSDAFRRARSAAERRLLESGVRLPPEYQAVNLVMQMFSPRTLGDDEAVASWLELFELTAAGAPVAPGLEWVDTDADHRAELRRVSAPCRVIAFADDLVCPPHLGAEVADAIPNCDLVEIPGCGHLGHLERPGPVNDAIVEFFDKH
ncbi:hydrolase [Actinomadura sp. NBRC 104425]|uniref:alpha/beta fold hydrolase n=1 Tax=Actinomadura sp. NBRC 104425 TaxID=3032204 RepID=UPI00249FF00D|nr:alpha/beta fold hydrolase [Actinomadura sp. NBRC 104425]GLZ14912.1 hydrolase [Actinomadura sp. NBRC 104425]